jgi:ABC-type oligopeptide transport system substrate-binding subunit
MKKVLAFLLALSMCLALVTGCTKIDSEDPAQKGPEFDVYLGTKVMNLDPAISYTDENAVKILSLIFEGLTKLDENGKLKKALAKKMEVTEDPKTGKERLEITINDTYWSDGSSVQANDVIYAWKRILDPNFDSPAASMLYCIKGAKDAKLGNISIDDIGLYSVKKDKFIVEFEEGTDIDEFIYNTSSPALVPLRENKVASYPDTWSRSATDLSTNGPFRVKKFSDDPKEHITLERSKYYYLNQEVETEAIDKFVTPFRIHVRYDVPMDKNVVSSSAETDIITMYNNKELFYVTGLTAATAPAYGDAVQIEEEASAFMFYFNMNTSAFKESAIRKAFSMALDREYVASLVGLGTTPATGVLNDKVYDTKKGTSFREEGGAILSPKGDLEGAKAVLKDADIYPEDYDDIYVLVRQNELNDSYASAQLGFMSNEKAIAQYAASVWKQLGFNVVVRATDSATFEDAYKTGDYDVVGMDYQMISTYPVYDLAAFSAEYSGKAVPVKNYKNEQFDALLASAFEETDAAKRAEILHEAEAVLLADNAVVPVIFNTNAYVVSKELSKVTTNYWGVQMFTKTQLKDYVQYLPSVKAAAAKENEE